MVSVLRMEVIVCCYECAFSAASKEPKAGTAFSPVELHLHHCLLHILYINPTYPQSHNYISVLLVGVAIFIVINYKIFILRGDASYYVLLQKH